jgi:hypothetical protein
MNTPALRKQYPKLTERERFAALVAALIRDDEDEARALTDSASRELYESFEGGRLMRAFIVQALTYAAMQWKQAATTLLLASWAELPEEDADPQALSAEYAEAIGVSAYVFTARAEAWRALCQEYAIDGTALIDKLTADGDGLELALMEVILSKVAYTQEQVTALVPKAAGEDAVQITTADNLLSLWRDVIEGR